MTSINLLPWREKKREQNKKQFTILLGIGCISAVVVIFLINSYAKSLISKQTQRNDRLKQEIVKLDKQIETINQLKKVRQGLIARMSIVQSLQATRVLTVRLFDEIIKILPPGIYLYSAERNADKVTLKGFSQSNTEISQLMLNIAASPWLDNPTLTEIRKNLDTKNAPVNAQAPKKESTENDFILNFTVKNKLTNRKDEHKP